MQVTRADRGRLGAVTRTPQGFLRVDDSTPTRTGVLTYYNADGSTRRELRHPDDVGDPASLATLAGVPVTDGHPQEMVSAENVREHTRGHTGERVRLEGGLVRASVTVTDAGLIKKVDDGTARELSCGYTCDLVMEPGDYQGEKYDARQTKIVYNHLAVVPKGRAGAVARLNLDAMESPAEPEEGDKPPMPKISIDGAELEVSEQVAIAYNNQQRAIDAQKKTDAETLKTAQDAAKEAQKKADTAEARADEAAEKLKQRGDVDVPALVKARVALEKQAAPFLPKDAKADSLADLELKKLAITTARPDTKLDGKSDDYIAARFDGLVEDAAAGHNANLAGHILNRPTGDAGVPDHEAARKKRQDDLQNLTKQKEG